MRGILAAVMLFTRLPLWRVVQVDKRYFEEAIRYWPLVGMLTGGVTAGVLWGAAALFPYEIAVILAMVARLLLTGALHEDGLADFFDGFGGGTSKEKILAIMKDSHIGCYGTIGLIIYFLLYYTLLAALNPVIVMPIVLAADCFSKYCAAVMINTLPYVRKEEESKVHLLYHRVELLFFLLLGVVVLIPFLCIENGRLCWAVLPASLMAVALRFFLKVKIGGYTGDCCGASVLLIELVFYLSVVALLYGY